MTKTGNIRTAAVVAIRAPAVHGVSSIIIHTVLVHLLISGSPKVSQKTPVERFGEIHDD